MKNVQVQLKSWRNTTENHHQSLWCQTGFFHLYSKSFSLNSHTTHNPKDAQCLQMQRSKERQLCKPHGQENKALPTALTRPHVFVEVRVEAPRELLKVQRLLSTSAIGWGNQVSVELLLFSWEGPRNVAWSLLFPCVKAEQAKCRECLCWSRTQVTQVVPAKRNSSEWMLLALSVQERQAGNPGMCVGLGELWKRLWSNTEFWTHYLSCIQRLQEHWSCT